MAVSGTVPAAAGRRRLDPNRVARWIRRATWLLAIPAGLWFFTSFGSAWVPKGMDTVPTIEAGSWCILDRRQSTARVGSDVFVEGPDGVLLLSRIAALDASSITVLHPNAASPFPDSRVFGALPRRQLRGTVLAAFAPDQGEGVRRGR